MAWTPQHDPVTGEILGGTRRIERHLLTELLEEFPGIPITIVNVGPSYRYCAPTLSSEDKFRENRKRYLGVTPWMDLRRLDTSKSSDESDSEDDDEEGGSLDATAGSDEEKDKDAKDEQERIRFVTLDEFLMQEDWGGEGWFDENEVEEWREAVEKVDRLGVPIWKREDIRPL
ncbi:hypothetical protein I302_100420 [Kwoniella bestiolae CBS 10118]|uniref:Uncharacterized protein n=1 Tax=Kwoniella bestiolae CBS 10118 TaxID=1296100 RepID=A0A1B9G509_9TREE|nr:hypothetical protein I302_03796 [Kwoniella bestiolae CBS 10118]OCF26119.1 hypothetical protein I302_03796 [Kwoniella bestiolae CBS 10118]